VLTKKKRKKVKSFLLNTRMKKNSLTNPIFSHFFSTFFFFRSLKLFLLFLTVMAEMVGANNETSIMLFELLTMMWMKKTEILQGVNLFLSYLPFAKDGKKSFSFFFSLNFMLLLYVCAQRDERKSERVKKC
jgi:hypothetical protein